MERQNDKFLALARIAGHFAAAGAVLIGTVGLTGWFADLRFLTSFGLDYVPIAPSTAVLMCLFGLSFIAGEVNRSGVLRTTNLVIAASGTAIAATLLVLSFLGIQTEIEYLGLEISDHVGRAAIGHISPVTAFAFMLVGGGIITSICVQSTSRVVRRIRSAFVAGLAMTALALLLGYAVGSPILYQTAVIPPALPTSIGIACLAIALGARNAERYAAERKELPRFRAGSHLRPAFVFSGLGLVILIAGTLLLRGYARTFRDRSSTDLMAISELKVAELVAWREERRADASVFFQNSHFSELLDRFLETPEDTRLMRPMLSWISQVQRSYRYARVSVLDGEGNEVIAYPASEAPAQLARNASIAQESGQVTFFDLHRDRVGNAIRMTIIAPVLSANGSGTVSGSVALQVDPHNYLYPMIQSWPVASKTAETLLVRRDGQDVLFLNDLRFDENAALNLRAPLDRAELPAAMAVSGHEGLFEGKDYRQVPVVAVVRSVPDSPWFLIAKIDAAEFYAPMEGLFLAVIGFIIALLVALVSAGAAAWQRVSKSQYRDLYRSEVARKESEGRFKTTLQSIGDAVIATDVDGRIVHMNPVAEQLTGWPLTEAEGLPAERVFRIVNEESGDAVESPVQRVLRGGRIVGLANHTMLIARDGARIAIADSAAPITHDSGESIGVVLVFRDQTAERENNRKILESEKRLRSLFDLMSTGFALHEIVTDEFGNAVDYRFLDLNEAFTDLTGIGEDAIGRRVTEVLPGIEDDPSEWIGRFGRVALHGQAESFEAYLKPLDRWYSITAYSPELGKFATILTDIGERKRTELYLELQARMLANIGEAVMVSDPEDKVIYWNTAAERMYGFAGTDVLGRPTVDLIQSFDFRKQRAKIMERLAADESWSGELSVGRDDGSDFFVLMTQTPIFDDQGNLSAAIGISRDITPRKTVEKRYAGLFHGVWDALLVANTDRRIVDCNDAFSKLFGYTLDEIRGEKTHVVYASIDEFERMGRELKDHSEEPEFRVTVEYRKKSGTTFRGETAAHYLRDDNGNINEFVGMIRDLTDQELIERQLIESQKMEGLGQMAGGIAHDFNNVLASISGASQALDQRVQDTTSRRHLAAILSGVQRGIAVTARMLTFTRSSAPETKSVALGSFLSEFRDLIRHSLPQNVHVHIRNVYDHQRVLIDPIQLQQVLFTLAGNASDAMPDGGNIQVTVREATAQETRVHEDGHVPGKSFWCMEFTDEGIGMDEETQSHVFEPFFTTKESTKGTGLGLAVAYRIIQMHGGWISVSSAPGQGTTMAIGLPEGEEAAVEETVVESFQPGTGETLLLVDDEEPILVMLEEILGANGYETVTATAGGLALQILQQSGPQIDVLITDIGLPDINGRELISQTRAMYPEMPIIATTGYVDQSLGDSLLASGANEVLKKPFDVNVLSGKIKALLMGRK